MDNNKQNIIKDIAQELDCGFDCYYHPRTKEIIAVPNLTQFSDEEHFNEAFSDSLGKIKQHQKDFIKFDVLDSFESFKIMERFVEQITDEKLKTKLKDILTNKKQFQNFKNKIDPIWI